MSIAIIYEQIADKVKEFIASLEIDTLYEIVRERTPFEKGGTSYFKAKCPRTILRLARHSHIS